MEKEKSNENRIFAAMDYMFRGIDPEQRDKIKGSAEDKVDIESLLEDKNQFVPSNRFYTRNSGKIEYIQDEMKSTLGKLKLLHEIAHKKLKHSGRASDKENLENERVAWLCAVESLKKLGLEIDNNLASEIIKYFDTYKKQIERKSVCIACGSKNTEEFAPQHYTCKDCYCDW